MSFNVNRDLAAADPAILSGVKEIKQRSIERTNELRKKSCHAGGTEEINFLTNANLERARVVEEIVVLLKDTSALLSAVSSMSKTCSGKIPRLDQIKIATRGACVGGCDDNGLDIVDSYIPYDLIKYTAGFLVPTDFMECNELGEPQRVTSIMEAMMLTTIRNDMELAFIYGDERLPVGAGRSDSNNLLGVNDGILKTVAECAPTNQIIDAEGAGLSPALYMAARSSVPARYRPLINDWRFIQGPGASAWYTQYLANLGGTDASDNALRNGETARIWGNQLFEVPTWQECHNYDDNGINVEVTNILFCNPMNLMYIQGRTMNMMSEYDMRCDKTRYKTYWTQDAIVMEPEATVLIKNVRVCGGIPYAGCVKAANGPCTSNPAA